MSESLIINIAIIGLGFLVCFILLIFVIRGILELIIYIQNTPLTLVAVMPGNYQVQHG